MSRLWIWCLGATLVSGLYLATHWFPGPPTPRAPRAVLEPRRIDLGRVENPTTFKVRLENLGGALLHVQSVTCQHKAVTLNVPMYELGSGASEELTGVLDPTGLHGHFECGIVLQTDAKPQGIMIEAEIP